MFEKVVLRRSETGNPISAGQLAEALLFYQNVHLVIDSSSFSQLVRQLGPDSLLSILQRSHCTAVFCEETLATQSTQVGPLHAHSFVAFTLAGTQGSGSFASRQDRVAYMLGKEGVAHADAKRYAKAFLRYAPVRRLSGNFFLEGGISSAARSDLFDSDFVLAAVNATLQRIQGANSLGEQLRFDVIDSELGMYVFTNVDFDAINRCRAALPSPQDPITPAHLLSHFLEARADLAIASFYGGDFVASDLTSSIIKLRYPDFLRRRQLNAGELSHFHQVVLPDYPSLRESIDSGQRSFKDFLHLLDKAARFKEWLRGAAVDEGLVRSYVSDLKREGWIQSVPSKTVRYLFTAALEAHNPMIGAAAAVTDSLFIEKLLGGWRPNHFVENRLEPFLQP